MIFFVFSRFFEVLAVFLTILIDISYSGGHTRRWETTSLLKTSKMYASETEMIRVSVLSTRPQRPLRICELARCHKCTAPRWCNLDLCVQITSWELYETPNEWEGLYRRCFRGVLKSCCIFRIHMCMCFFSGNIVTQRIHHMIRNGQNVLISGTGATAILTPKIANIISGYWLCIRLYSTIFYYIPT